MPEKWLIGAELLFGFLWLRNRFRGLGEGGGTKAMVGIFFVLGPALLGEKWLFDRLPFGRPVNFLIEALILALTFWMIAFVFLRPGRVTPAS